MDKRHFLSKLAFCASFFAVLVIALGAFTRLTDAGLGCPDWPGCYGHITAPLAQTSQAYKAWAEMIHRYVVGILSILIIFMIAAIFTQKKVRTRGNVILAIFLMLLLSYQIMLGQWTVTLKLLPVIVTQHLVGGYFILATIWLVYLNNQSSPLIKNTSAVLKILPWAVLGLVLLLGQIVLGAWTSTNYASLSCIDFPFCSNDQVTGWHFKEAFNIFSPVGMNYEGGLLPIMIRQTIQMAHRLGAFTVAVYFILFVAIASVQLKNRPDLLKIIYVMLGLLCVQLCVGISNVTFKLPLMIAMSHTILAALLLVSLITLIFKLRGASTA